MISRWVSFCTFKPVFLGYEQSVTSEKEEELGKLRKKKKTTGEGMQSQWFNIHTLLQNSYKTRLKMSRFMK